MILSRVLLLPFIAAIDYEVTQFGAGHMDNPIIYARADDSGIVVTEIDYRRT